MPTAVTSSPSQQLVGPPPGPDPDHLPHRVDHVVALEQQLERIEQPDVEQTHDLLDEIVARPVTGPGNRYLTPDVK